MRQTAIATIIIHQSSLGRHKSISLSFFFYVLHFPLLISSPIFHTGKTTD